MITGKEVYNMLYKRYWRFFILPNIHYFFISFPKSGRTWVKYFLSQYFHHAYGLPLSFNFHKLRRINKDIPRIKFGHIANNLENIEKIKEALDIYKNKKIIFLIRDPRDVVVSYYFQVLKRGTKISAPKNMTISEFIRHEVCGIGRVIDYMNILYDLRNGFKGFMMLKYEDCRNQTKENFMKIFKFLDIKNIDETAFDRAIQESSFENMRKAEEKGEIDDKALKPADKSDPESFKVRKGIIGGYTQYLNEEDVIYVDKEMEKLNKAFGYKI